MSPEAEIIALIGERGGASNAIQITEIVDRMAGVGDGWVTPRFVKQTVRNGRRAGMKIGSTRVAKHSPPGYYMIETSAELGATVRPLLRQAIDQLRTVEALTGKDYFSLELAGQMRLF